MSEQQIQTGASERDENIAQLKRQGRRRTAGHDTPSGPLTDRSPTPAKREQAEREDEGIETEEVKHAR
jgi:hypothetical protein